MGSVILCVSLLCIMWQQFLVRKEHNRMARERDGNTGNGDGDLVTYTGNAYEE